MDKIEIKKILKPIIWDYDIDPYDLYCAAIGQEKSVGGFTQKKCLDADA
ncbi:hypothetical protein KJ854_05495 [Patescibacteria group bacterium]|nr:hypothetical protein [Patescibacteria group bacterium]